MSELAAILPELRRPFTPEAVRFKIQTNPKTATGKALVVAYIDARHVGSRLNLTVPGEWSSAFEEVQGGVMCRLTVCGQTRCDVGWSKGTGVDMDLKARYSDALKRSAVHFGIGEFLYALPQERVSARDLDSWGSPPKYALGDKAMAALRKSYTGWLASERNIFGEPRDHGDGPNSQGDVETEPVSEAEEDKGAATDTGSKPKKAKANTEPPPPAPNPDGVLDRLRELVGAAGWNTNTLRLHLTTVGVPNTEDVPAAMAGLTIEQAGQLAEAAGGSLEGLVA